MAGNFITYLGEDLEKIFVDDYAMIDQFANTGSLWSWGKNNSGVLGDNTIAHKSSPVQTVSGGTSWKSLADGGGSFTAAIKTDGTLWLWGVGTSGQLGNSAITSRSSPVQTAAAGTTWKQVACGNDFAIAIKTDGTLWAWGTNTNGQLGDNTNTNKKSSPVQTVAAGTNWKQVASGTAHTAAVKIDGTLWTWGTGTSGALGDGTPGTSRSSPVQTVAAGTTWKQAACGDKVTAAIKTDGTLWMWGVNSNGQLGDNTIVPKSSPVQTVAGGTNWKQVRVGIDNTAAIKTDGTLWTWGGNNNGQLGDNTNGNNKSSPVQTVAGGTNWKQVSCGYQTCGAIKTDGTLWTWGRNGYGALGNNAINSQSSPVQTAASGTNWKQVVTNTIQNEGMHAIYFYDAGNLYPSA